MTYSLFQEWQSVLEQALCRSICNQQRAWTPHLLQVALLCVCLPVPQKFSFLESHQKGDFRSFHPNFGMRYCWKTELWCFIKNQIRLVQYISNIRFIAKAIRNFQQEADEESLALKTWRMRLQTDKPINHTGQFCRSWCGIAAMCLCCDRSLGSVSNLLWDKKIWF